MSVERLRERLNAVETRAGMSTADIDAVSIKMNTIIREELTYARNENNTAQFAKLLEEYQEVWRNKPGLAGIEVNLRGSNLSGAVLRGTNLIKADLSGAELSGAELIRANLMGVNLSGSNLLGASLIKANLSGANLSGASLLGAFLSEANLSGANLIGADLRHANLSGANLSGAILIGHDLSIEVENTLANAIITPDELLKAIKPFLKPSLKNPITLEKLNMFRTLHIAASEIGTKGVKDRDGTAEIYAPHGGLRDICKEIDSHPILNLFLRDSIPDRVKRVLERDVVVDVIKLFSAYAEDKAVHSLQELALKASLDQLAMKKKVPVSDVVIDLINRENFDKTDQELIIYLATEIKADLATFAMVGTNNANVPSASSVSLTSAAATNLCPNGQGL